MLQRNKMQNL